MAPAGQAAELDDPNFSRTRLRLSSDRTFRLSHFPAESLPLPSGPEQGWLDCEGSWRVASDDGGFLYYLVVNKANGSATNLPLLFRPGDDLSILTTVYNQKCEQFRRRLKTTANP